MTAVDHGLSQFREKDSHPVLTVLGVIREIHELIGKHIEGANTLVAFLPDYKSAVKDFRAMLRNMTPAFDPATPGYKAPEISLTISDDDMEVDTPVVTPMKRKAPTSQSGTPRSVKKSRPEDAHKTRARFRITDVQTAYRLYASAALDGESSTVVSDMLIKESMLGWKFAVDEFMVKIKTMVESMVAKVSIHVLKSFRQSALGTELTQTLMDYLHNLLAKQKVEVEALLNKELHKPLTFSDMRPLKAEARSKLKQDRLERRMKEHCDTAEANGAKAMVEPERKKKLADTAWVTEKLGIDPADFEVEALVTPFAYYQMARFRFVDSVALHLQSDMLHTLSKDVHDMLVLKLNATDETACEALLVEDAGLERQRQALLNEKQKLATAMVELRNLPNLHTN